MMACTVRWLRPAVAAMSRIRARGLRAISTSTCPCPVSSVQLPAGLLPESHALRTFAPVETREISLACLRAGAVMQVGEDRNRLDVACSGHFRPAAGARGRGSLDGKVANTTGKACRPLRRIRTRPGPGSAVMGSLAGAARAAALRGGPCRWCRAGAKPR